MTYGDDVDKERNKVAAERIEFHLKETLRFCSLLDFSGFGPLEQREWDTRIKNCKDAIEFCRESLKKLNQTLE